VIIKVLIDFQRNSPFFSEISTLLTEVNDLKMELMETQKNVDRKEKEILKIHETVSFCVYSCCFSVNIV
jgi:purine nucleoside phosphorylase